MNVILIECGVILVLLVVNGVFAMTEIAVVSAKKTRLRRLADQGNGKAGIALELAESPNRFLSTVQIGITLVGIFAGAFGGATLTAKLAGPIGQVSFLAQYADKIAFGLVVAVITYFSLVLGELVPKRFGLSNPEGIAMMMARPMNWLSKFGGAAYTEHQTLAGFVVKALGHVPKEGETIESHGYVFEILDMDRHRVDKVLVMPASDEGDRPK